MIKIYNKSKEFVSERFSISEFEESIRNWFRAIGSNNLIVCATETCPEKTLLPIEETIVTNAVATRRAEFAAGRYCGRKALNHLGYQNVPIMKGDKGEPIWPKPIVGSITHDQGIAIAVVSTRQTTTAVGIDLLALNNIIDTSTEHLFTNTSELENISLMLSKHDCETVDDSLNTPRLLAFSAKEAAIKNLSPLIDHYLNFQEIEIVCRGDIIQTIFPNLNLVLNVRWHISNNMLFTISYTT